MKVIKQLKSEMPQKRLKKYFVQTPLMTISILIINVLGSITNWILFGSSLSYNIMSLIAINSLLQFLLYLVIAITDLRRQQNKGTIFLALEIIIQNIIIFAIHLTISFFFDWPSCNLQLAFTSLPMQNLIILATMDAIEQPHSLKFFLISIFQIKSAFYLVFIIILLEIFSFRIDISIAIFLGIILHIVKFRSLLQICSKFLDEKMFKDVQAEFFIKSCQKKKQKIISSLATSNSIVLQQKP